MAVASVGACGSTPTAPPPPDPADLSILFVGNSLTYWNDLPAMLAGLLAGSEAGENFLIESFAYPNYGLQDHWADGRARARIADGGWDYVVLQQGPSATEGRPSLLQYTELFDQEIRAVGAQTAVYMVWPAEARSFDFDGVVDSYATAAEQVGGVLFPVGEAWRVAWEGNEALSLYDADRFHPSPLGSFLGAIVMYQRLTGAEARDFPAAIHQGDSSFAIEAQLADLLFEAALEANRRYP